MMKYVAIALAPALGLINLPYALEGNVFSWASLAACWVIGFAGFLFTRRQNRR